MIIGIDAYLWFMGGNLCIISNEVLRELLLKATRWETRDSQRIKRKNITEIMEMMDPILATTFQS